MAHTRRTFLLDRKTWDITLDGVGRITLAGDDYATAQNVANEARLFTQDAYFTQDQGVPHYLISLGRRTNASVLRSHLCRAALRVPDVKEVLAVEINSFNPKSRTLTGDIRFTTIKGAQNGAIQTYF